MPNDVERLSSQRVNLTKVSGTAQHESADWVAVEEPLAIQLGYGPLVDRRRDTLIVTMRTPGQDAELALGWLYAEAIINELADVLGTQPAAAEQRLLVELAPDVHVDVTRLGRFGVTHSSCGWCGQTSLDQFARQCYPLPPGPVIPAGRIHSLPAQLAAAQQGFQHSGGLHAAGLFDQAGNLLFHAEDVGRHNALDKLVGMLWKSGVLPLSEGLILMTSRGSLELVQKAARAGVPILATVGAPTSSAIRYAEELGLTLLGFVRDQRFNVYTNPERISLSAGTA